MYQRLGKLFFLLVVLGAGAEATLPPKTPESVLKGRFVAQAKTNLEDVGSFIGYGEVYVFEVEGLNGARYLVKIAYTFRVLKDRLASSYLDYSVLRSLVVTKDSLCNDTLSHMAYTQDVDASGHFREHQFTLKPAKNAPELKISDDMLACYALTPQGVKRSLPKVSRQK
ncbi:MAG TPA: hypothetical protein VNW97_18680 [Candidatus Saccharimonadales bacterium]|nr:hypothetical protein [Candidatus Saccharimonadales bacterium]